MKLKTMIGAGLIALLSYTADAQVKASLTQSQILINGNQPLVRTEASLNDMPLKSEFYCTRDGLVNNVNFYKFRIQSLPASVGPVSAGVSLQHVDAGKSIDELGAGIKIAGKPLENVVSSLGTQYYPKNDKIDFYGTTNIGTIIGDVFVDALGSYNTETKTGFIRPGIDYLINIGDVKVGLGFETKLSGKIGNLNDEYVGLRLKVKI